jgi:hypothetical protein
LDAERFDTFVQSFAGRRSRRGVLRALAAGAVSAPAVVRGRSAAAGALTCISNGDKCSLAAPDQCCSGICKKKHGKARCKKAPAAFGCTNLQDSCQGPNIDCPNRAAPGLCFVDANHVPFCADANTQFTCNDCAGDQECVDLFGDGAFCLFCPDCVEFSTTSACVKPAKVKKRK